VERSGPHHDPADVVLEYVKEHPEITRLVIGIKRRTPVGKAVFPACQGELRPAVQSKSA
jgi:hypothetical protein